MSISTNNTSDDYILEPNLLLKTVFPEIPSEAKLLGTTLKRDIF